MSRNYHQNFYIDTATIMPEMDEWLTISYILFEFYELNPRFVKTTSHGYKKKQFALHVKPMRHPKLLYIETNS